MSSNGYSLNDIAALTRELLDRHGLRDWSFTFGRSKTRLGSCEFGRRLITLSSHLVQLNGLREIKDTILHEIAHALVGPRHGHDTTWRAKCREIGAKPQRCSTQAIMPPVERRWVARCEPEN